MRWAVSVWISVHLILQVTSHDPLTSSYTCKPSHSHFLWQARALLSWPLAVPKCHFGKVIYCPRPCCQRGMSHMSDWPQDAWLTLLTNSRNDESAEESISIYAAFRCVCMCVQEMLIMCTTRDVWKLAFWGKPILKRYEHISTYTHCTWVPLCA